MIPAAASADCSRSAKLRRGQQFLDGGELPCLLGDRSLIFTDQFIALSSSPAVLASLSRR